MYLFKLITGVKEEKITCKDLSRISSLFHNMLNQFNYTRAQPLDAIYQMTKMRMPLKLRFLA